MRSMVYHTVSRVRFVGKNMKYLRKYPEFLYPHLSIYLKLQCSLFIDYAHLSFAYLTLPHANLIYLMARDGMWESRSGKLQFVIQQFISINMRYDIGV